jgi:hypothetical protein
MNVPNVQESSAIVLALATLYVIVREILVPQFRKERQERREEDRPGHFRCEAGRFDQRLSMLEDHDKSDDRRIGGLSEKLDEMDEKLGPMSTKLDVVIERVNWLVKVGRSQSFGP